MRSFIRKFRPSLSLFMVIVFTTAQFTACSGGSDAPSDTGASQGSQARLSQSSRYPGQFLTIEQNTILFGQTVPVTFQDANGYSVTIDGTAAENGAVQVQTPPYLHSGDAAASAGTVSISIPGSDRFADLDIQAPMELEYTNGTQPGYYLRWWLNANLQTDGETLNTLDAFQSDTTALRNSMADNIQLIRSAIDAYDASGTFTIHIQDLGYVNLSEAELRLADQLLYAYCAGALEALETGRSGASRSALDGYFGPGANQTQEQVLQLLSDTRVKLETAMRQADAGTAILIGLASATAALGALIFGGKFALLVGAFGAIGYVLSAGIHSEGLSWLSSQITSGLEGASSYIAGTQLLNHMYDAAQSFASNLASGVSATGDLLNDLYTSLTTLEAERELVCATHQPQSLLFPAPRAATALSPADQFCDDTAVDPLQAAFSSAPDSLDQQQSGTFGVTISGGKPIYKIDLNWGDQTSATQYLIHQTFSATHAYTADGTYTVSATVTDIAGQTATAHTILTVDGTSGQTAVTFQDMWDVYTVTLTFPDGQADGHTVVTDTDVYNTDELVEITLPHFPADPNQWPSNTISVQITISGADFADWLFYSNASKSDWSRRSLITHATSAVQQVGGSRYYFLEIHPDSGPYRTVAFRLKGTEN